jgi:hypothetical protein
MGVSGSEEEVCKRRTNIDKKESLKKAQNNSQLKGKEIVMITLDENAKVVPWRKYG